MAKFVLILVSWLLAESPETTDDSWDCYAQVAADGTVLEICERDLQPCHYERDPVTECKVVLRRPLEVTL